MIRKTLLAATVLATSLGIALAPAPYMAALAQAQPAAPASEYTPQSGQAGKDVVWVPSPQALVDRMLDMAAAKPGDILFDLGSGDGRTVITAAKRGIEAYGIEYNPDLVALAQRNAEKEGVGEKAKFTKGDIFESDFSKATVLTLFLLPNLNMKLRPTILDMKPGTRVVSNSFMMEDWEPDDRIEASGDCTSYCRAFKWVVPAKVGGTWKFEGGQLELKQTFQKLEGTLTTGGKALPISDAKMNGVEITFTADGKTYKGKVDGDALQASDGSAKIDAKRGV